MQIRSRRVGEQRARRIAKVGAQRASRTAEPREPAQPLGPGRQELVLMLVTVGNEKSAELRCREFLPKRTHGRGRALRTAWLNSDADVLCYMDVDLSTNLRALPPLLAALIHSDYDLGTGSRLMHGAIVTRQWRRELISRCYNWMIRLMFWNRFRDAQCGFKAITREAAHKLIPQVKDNAWFFDSELLLKAEMKGYRIFEVPVEWIEDLGSTVKIVKTAWEDIKGLVRVRVGG